MKENGFKQILYKHYGVNGRSLLRPMGPNIAWFQHMSGPALIKIHDPLTHPNRTYLEAVYLLMDGLELSPGFIPSLYNRLLGRDGDTIFSVQRFRAGRPINPGELVQLAEPLALLHAGFKRLDHPPVQNHLQRVVTDIRGAMRDYGFERLEWAVDQAEQCFAESPKGFIHGDLHPSNIIYSGDRILFIDADSSSFAHAALDVAFVVFRCGHGRQDEIRAFVDAYNRLAPDPVNPAYLAPLTVYTILERILFILVERDAGRDQWMEDLANQLVFLKRAAGMGKAATPNQAAIHPL